jgi:hypothetical protein
MDIKNIHKLISLTNKEIDKNYIASNEYINKYLPLKCINHSSYLIHACVDKRNEKKLNEKERKLFDD